MAWREPSVCGDGAEGRGTPFATARGRKGTGVGVESRGRGRKGGGARGRAEVEVEEAGEVVKNGLRGNGILRREVWKEW